MSFVPGTVAVFDTGFHTDGSIHIQVGTCTSWACVSSGFIWMTGFGSTSSRTACCASTDGAGVASLACAGFGEEPSKRGRIPTPFPM